MKKEPLLQVSKRRNKAGWQERLLIRFIALLLALIVCGAVIVALVKMNPVDVYKAIWDGAMGSERRLWQTIRDTMVLLCVRLTPVHPCTILVISQFRLRSPRSSK